MYKPPKVNFLYRINSGVLIGMIAISVPVLLALGKALSDYQNTELKQTVEMQAQIHQKDTAIISDLKQRLAKTLHKIAMDTTKR